MTFVPLRVPRETVNDDRYLVKDVLIKSGAQLAQGSVVAVLESSKAAFEINAPRDGFVFLHPKLCVGQSVTVGQVLALLSEKSATNPSSSDFDLNPDSNSPILSPPSPPPEGGAHFSQAALKALEKHKLSFELFTGRALVTERDVLAMVKQATFKAPKPTKTSLLFLGAGGLARMCVDLVRATAEFSAFGYVDRNVSAGTLVLDLPVLGPDSNEFLVQLRKSGVAFAVNSVASLSNPADRAHQLERLKQAGFELPNLIHRSSVVEPSAKLGSGNQIHAHATVCSAVSIKDNCIINTGAIVSHDCHLDNNVHIAPGAILAGSITVGHDTLIGMGVTIFVGVKIGHSVIIPNGAKVFKDVPDHTTLKSI